MEEVTITSYDGVPIRTYHSRLAPGRENVVIVLPLATRPSFIAPAIERLTEQYNIITWESRLILEPHVPAQDPGSLSIESSNKDLNAIYDYFQISSAYMLGYCSGAAAALYMAAHNPGRVHRLALVNGAYFLTGGECDLTQYEQDVIGLLPQIASDRNRASYILHKFFANGTGSARFGNPEFGEETCRPFSNADSLYRFGLGLRNFMSHDSQKEAREITVPALVASGKRDDRTHYSSSILIQTQLRNSEFYLDSTGDHYELCRGKPELLETLTGFFSKC